MDAAIVARWRTWSGGGLEHLVLREEANGVTAEAALLADGPAGAFAVCYRILCDRRWRTRRLALRLIGEERGIELTSDGAGAWADGSGLPLADLKGAIDIDLSATPFTNTLPIRRLGLRAGQSAEILAVHVRLPDLAIAADRQRYTCLDPGRSYRFEAVDGGFARELAVDDHGLVVTYPGLFRRVP